MINVKKINYRTNLIETETLCTGDQPVFFNYPVKPVFFNYPVNIKRSFTVINDNFISFYISKES